jgi:hypothetical protein
MAWWQYLLLYLGTPVAAGLLLWAACAHHDHRHDRPRT